MFTLERGTDMKGQAWATVEPTKNYSGLSASNLSRQVLLAREALQLCHEEMSTIFRVNTQWNEAFGNIRQSLVARSVLGIAGGKKNIDIAEETLAEAFNAFSKVVNKLNDRIHVSTQSAMKAQKKRTTTKGDKMRTEARRLKKQGLTNIDIAARLKCSKSHVTGLLKSTPE